LGGEPQEDQAPDARARLAATRDHGTATGPGSETEIDMAATGALCSGVELLNSLQCDHADTVAKDYGWPSAMELMRFLTEGTETARFRQ